MGVFIQHLSEKPLPPKEQAPERNIPSALNFLILKALEKNPAKRYQTLEELIAELRSAVPDECRFKTNVFAQGLFRDKRALKKAAFIVSLLLVPLVSLLYFYEKKSQIAEELSVIAEKQSEE